MVDDKVETEFIENVPNELVVQFQQAFPDQPDLHEFVKRGWCDHVADILKAIGDQDEEYVYRVFNDEQNAAAESWWRHYDVVWNSK